MIHFMKMIKNLFCFKNNINEITMEIFYIIVYTILAKLRFIS